MNERLISIHAQETDGAHGSDVSASLRRVSQLEARIVSARPISGARLLRLLQSAEVSIAGITMAEIEYASYLAGLADKVR